MENYGIALTFTETLLGTIPAKKIFGEQGLGQGNPDESETAPDAEDLLEEGAAELPTTGFHTVDGKPVFYDYMVKGFFKDACGMLRRDSKSGSAKLTAHKKIIDGLVFVAPPRVIPIVLSGPTTFCERPLRAATARGGADLPGAQRGGARRVLHLVRGHGHLLRE
jgi:hypothetical protein